LNFEYLWDELLKILRFFASTAVIPAPGCALSYDTPPPPVFEFDCDHPFAFFIAHNQKTAVFGGRFAGRP
jgi:hypothetical protein